MEESDGPVALAAAIDQSRLVAIDHRQGRPQTRTPVCHLLRAWHRAYHLISAAQLVNYNRHH